MKTTTASPKVKKTGPALLKKLARELAIIADHDQKTILRLAAYLALAANGIQPITSLPLDKRALNELWTIFGSADRANRAPSKTNWQAHWTTQSLPECSQLHWLWSK
ncbi:MAG: hypothetical protein IPJ49_14290 [Candidatus Obscuribacter sp.]|nr:hypothetical protein [Candidatus Obscuribacter sp.]